MDERRVISIAIKTLGFIFGLCMLWGTFLAHAEVSIASDVITTVFRVEGKNVSPREAEEAALKHTVEKCMPIKGAQTKDGGTAAAYRCHVVVLEYNPKTGLPHWRNK